VAGVLAAVDPAASTLWAMTTARLIALDWGTTNLRASLLSDGGAAIETRSAAGGIMAVPERRFAPALLALCGDWLAEHRCPLVASGMIGSRQGWQEAPYLECPARPDDAAARLTRVAVQAGTTLHIVPGLRCIGGDGQDDVMRGEETQLWGAALSAGHCCVLPGTHSKWAWMGGGDSIERFQTYMTGELYGLLTQHGILGKLMRFGEASAEGFERGARIGLAEPGISGILIGAEIGGALRHGAPERVALLGDAGLCARYASALRLAGVESDRVPEDATTRGQWRLAAAAGLAIEA
jgi:2-dehydro-3-deoxygalactonokinase